MKCVSKEWFQLISSPLFKNLYSTTKTPRALVVKESTKGHPVLFGQPLSRTLFVSTIDISTGETCKEFTKDIIGSHYSFILSDNLILFEKFTAIAVCNPTTHEIVHLPLPSQPTVRYRLGYHQAKNEYKIIHSFRRSENYDLGFEIITLKDGGPVPVTWRTVKFERPSPIRWYFDNTLIDYVDADGAMNWLVDARQGNKGGKTIFQLEMETERFGTIGYPPDHLLEENESEQLVNIQGSLCLAYYSKQSSTITMYLLKDRSDQIWEMEYKIELHDINKNVGNDLRIIGYLPGEDQNGEILIKTNEMKAILYNINTRSFRTIEHIWIGWCKNLYFDRFFTLGKK
ncbi:hypothetical protein LIER_17614 [Lithospermum erythrorhizon]|uniref:F-box associated beta-propeller type 3 domain-containing protein n=1 Tax=Lithospermum erythrorhizon TaxID=34254 RepID=A0AAV3QF35_LITER